VRRNGEFTVQHRSHGAGGRAGGCGRRVAVPVAGVLYAPVRTSCTSPAGGAPSGRTGRRARRGRRGARRGGRAATAVREPRRAAYTIVASRSHSSPETEAFIRRPSASTVASSSPAWQRAQDLPVAEAPPTSTRASRRPWSGTPRPATPSRSKRAATWSIRERRGAALQQARPGQPLVPGALTGTGTDFPRRVLMNLHPGPSGPSARSSSLSPRWRRSPPRTNRWPPASTATRARAAAVLVFASEGDLWKVPARGCGPAADRPRGRGALSARLARRRLDRFTAQYEGNDDVYVMPWRAASRSG